MTTRHEESDDLPDIPDEVEEAVLEILDSSDSTEERERRIGELCTEHPGLVLRHKLHHPEHLIHPDRPFHCFLQNKDWVVNK